MVSASDHQRGTGWESTCSHMKVLALKKKLLGSMSILFLQICLAIAQANVSADFVQLEPCL